MINNLKYAIMAIVFIGLAKVLQVTLFDADKYKKNKDDSFTKTAPVKAKSKKEKDKKKETPITIPAKDEKQTSSSEQQSKKDDDQQKAESQSQPKEQSTSTSTDNGGATLSDLTNGYLALKLAELPPGHLREDVVIRYYKHEKDGSKVEQLKDLGYYIHVREATETAGLGSNVLYYGDQVASEDIQLVAYTLLNKGIPLKSIQKTRFEWKSNAMEIGTDTLLLDKPNLTRKQVQEFIRN